MVNVAFTVFRASARMRKSARSIMQNRGIMPFLLADILRLLLFPVPPALVLWLPGTMA